VATHENSFVNYGQIIFFNQKFTISSLEEMVDLASEDNSLTLRAGKF
jgi:hypothetical protein